MTHRRNRQRPCILIVEEDMDFGIRLADWLASHRYQAVLVRSLQAAGMEFLEILPDAVVVGLTQTGSAFPINLQKLFRVVETACTPVPVITIGNRTCGVLTSLLHGGAFRHLNLPIKPIEFTYIGRLLRSELNAATVEPYSPSRKAGHSASRSAENRVHAHTVDREAATWIA
jgi:DNA-binding response OmpR family regulator